MKFDPNQLALHTGTEHYFRLSRRCLLTDGAKYLADGAGAYWLMEDSSSYLMELGTDDWFVLIRLLVSSSEAMLIFEDGNGNVRAQQVIPYTNFPLNQQILYACWDGEQWVLMLSSEY